MYLRPTFAPSAGSTRPPGGAPSDSEQAHSANATAPLSNDAFDVIASGHGSQPLITSRGNRNSPLELAERGKARLEAEGFFNLGRLIAPKARAELGRQRLTEGVDEVPNLTTSVARALPPYGPVDALCWLAGHRNSGGYVAVARRDGLQLLFPRAPGATPANARPDIRANIELSGRCLSLCAAKGGDEMRVAWRSDELAATTMLYTGQLDPQTGRLGSLARPRVHDEQNELQNLMGHVGRAVLTPNAKWWALWGPNLPPRLYSNCFNRPVTPRWDALLAERQVQDISWSCDGNRTAILDDQGTVHVLRHRREDWAHRAQISVPASSHTLLWVNNCRHLVARGTEGLFVVDVDGQTRAFVNGSAGVGACVSSPAGTKVAAAVGRKVFFLQVPTFMQVDGPLRVPHGVTALAWNWRGLAVGTAGGDVVTFHREGAGGRARPAG